MKHNTSTGLMGRAFLTRRVTTILTHAAFGQTYLGCNSNKVVDAVDLLLDIFKHRPTKITQYYTFCD